MNILYLSPSYIPSRRANSIQVMKMCEAFAQVGHDVTLISKHNPDVLEPNVGDDYRFYGVEPNFRILKVRRPSGSGGGLAYALGLGRHVWRLRQHADVAYARDVAAAYLAVLAGLPTVYEIHEFPQRRLSRVMHRVLFGSRVLRRVVANSRYLRDAVHATGWVRTADIVVGYVGTEQLDGVGPPRTDLGQERPKLGYVGNLYPGKGMEVIAGLASRLPECDIHVVGGEERDLAAWRRHGLAANIILHGFVPPADLSIYYGMCDVLLLPVQREVYGGSRRTDFGRWTTPLKMFEYMAAGRPIVASDLPLIREVLEHGRNALLVPPDDLAAWEAAARSLLADGGLRLRLAQAALEDFHRDYTRRARARFVLEGLVESR